MLREQVRRMAPGLMADRARRFERGLRDERGVTALAERLLTGGELRVQGGVFSGLRYAARSVADVDAPVAKALGTYEQEIAPVFRAAVERGTPTFIDVGCADGYYAVGMALKGAITYAYDLSRSARALCEQTAALNGVGGRVRVGRRFTADSLTYDTAGALVLCDIEGGEVDMFDAHLGEALRLAHIVIEVHEDTMPGASKALVGALAASHAAERIVQEPRVPPPMTGWTEEERRLAVDELRHPANHWLYFRPR